MSNLIDTRIATTVDLPPTKDQLDAVEQAENTLRRQTDAKKLERLKRAVYWQAKARTENLSEIDQFMKYWIGFEVLIEGNGDAVVPKATDQLKPIYPDVDRIIIHEVVGRIYGVRKNIFHEGIRSPEELPGKLQQLKDIMTDLLRERLEASRKNLSRRHFTG